MQNILAIDVNGISYNDTADKTIAWAKRGESRAIVFANVHMTMEAFDNPALRAALKRADIVNPDGMPMVWALRALGDREAKRVYGPDATEVILRRAAESGVSVGFYGSTESTLQTLLAKLRCRYPGLQIAFALSPPFRALSEEEDEEIVQSIVASGARILFVGLGCPKQEMWVMAHRDRIPAVMLAVGAAFDFLAGTKPQAPRWMMRSGLEWLFRLSCEPRRLAIRYFKHNPRFVGLMLYDLLGRRSSKQGR